MKNLIAILLIFITSLLSGQEDYVHNIKGQITEASTGLPLIGASVFILDSDPLIGTSTDENGYYRFDNLPVKRYSIACSYIGYKSQAANNMLLTTGKELIIDFALEEDLMTVEVEITAIKEQDVKSSELATVSVQTFNSEVASRYAGSRSDVARMAASFAGVSANDDSRNDIVIRGNSPAGLLWRLNGIDIPNPSHFGALGATGGPVSMLNNNLLSNSLFITGAFPANYGNALSGVFDLTMRKGNKDKLEGLFGVSFNGFEGGLEGPLGKKGGSFLLNYRYSVIDLISKLGGSASGATGTGDAIPRYQDLSFHINLPTEKLGSFGLFGIKGNSGIDFLSDLTTSDKPNLFSDSNDNLYYKSNMSVIGLTNKHYYNDKSYGKLNLSYSTSGVNTILDTVDVNLVEVPLYRDDSSRDRIRLAYEYKTKINKNNSIIAGVVANVIGFNFLDSIRRDETSFRTLRDYEGSANLWQGYGQYQFKPNEKLTLNAGIFTQQFSFNNTSAVDPRFSLRYNVSPKVSFNVGVGRHSKLQDYQLYLVQTRLPNGEYVETNNALEMTKSNQAVVGMDWAISPKWTIKTEGYLQNLSDVPVEEKASTFSAINLGADFNIPSRDSLVNSGTAQNYGLEVTLERSFSEGFYLLGTLSLFKSTYVASDGNRYSSAFDNDYVSNILVGKEFMINKKMSFSIDTKVTSAGGRRYTPIDLEASAREGEAVTITSSAFANQFDDYFRTDLKFTFRYNMRRISQSWSVDLQNVTNRDNVFGQTYDVRNNEVDITNQLGFFPVIEYRLNF